MNGNYAKAWPLKADDDEELVFFNAAFQHFNVFFNFPIADRRSRPDLSSLTCVTDVHTRVL